MNTTTKRRGRPKKKVDEGKAMKIIGVGYKANAKMKTQECATLEDVLIPNEGEGDGTISFKITIEDQDTDAPYRLVTIKYIYKTIDYVCTDKIPLYATTRAPGYESIRDRYTLIKKAWLAGRSKAFTNILFDIQELEHSIRYAMKN